MEKQATFFLLLNCIVFFGTSNAKDYCDLQCKDFFTGQIYPHTVCAYTQDVKCSQYGYELLASNLTITEQQKILNLHNELRYKLSVGLEHRGSPGPQPAAKEILPDLVWDPELAFIAQTWANQCDFQHDKCRKTASDEIGQNIGYVTASAKMLYENGPRGRKLVGYEISDIQVEKIVQAWWDEVENWNSADTYKPYRLNYGADVGHFTQMAWAKTTRIGCGAITYSQGQMDKRTYLVCNYGPSGNFLKKRMYIPYDDKNEGIELETWSQNLPNGSKNVRIQVEGTTVKVNYQIGRYTSTMTMPLPNAVIQSANAIPAKNGQIAVVIKYYYNS